MAKKIVIIGPAKSGKTKLVYSLLGGVDKQLVTTNQGTYEIAIPMTGSLRYIPTLGVEVHPFEHGKDGKVDCWNFWDCAGNPRFTGLGDGYFICADAAIIFGDEEEAQRHLYQFRRVREHAPFIRASINDKPEDVVQRLAAVL